MNANKPNRKALFNFYNREGGYAVLIPKYLQHIQDIRQLYDFQRDGFEDYPAKPTMWMRTMIRSDIILNRVAERKSLLPGSNVLDLGCGDGYLSYRMAKVRFTVTGIDISLPRVKTSRCVAQFGGVGSNRFLVGDAENIPCRKSFFSLILFSEVFEHLPDPLKAIHEIGRVAKREAVLILTTPNKYNIYENLALAKRNVMRLFRKGRPLPLGVGHISVCSSRIIRQYLTESDFEILSQSYCDFAIQRRFLDKLIVKFRIPIEKFFGVEEVLQKMPLIKRLFGQTVVFVCKKTIRNLQG